MADSGILPGLRGREGNQRMKHIGGNMKKMIYVSIFGYTLSSLQELGGNKPQITFHLTVLNDHRSNI